jgi:hypothetical protein
MQRRHWAPVSTTYHFFFHVPAGHQQTKTLELVL